MTSKSTLEEFIKQKILTIRGRIVILDEDLTELYGVSTKVLNQAVKRNIQRFPEDFMFRLTMSEKRELPTKYDYLKSSIQLPSAFTEEGVAMLSSVLNNKRAVEINIAIIRMICDIQADEDIKKGRVTKTKNLEELFKELDH